MGILSFIFDSSSQSGKEYYRKQLESVLRSIEWEKEQIARERTRIEQNKKNPNVVKTARMVIEQRKKTIEQKKRMAANLREAMKRAK